MLGGVDVGVSVVEVAELVLSLVLGGNGDSSDEGSRDAELGGEVLGFGSLDSGVGVGISLDTGVDGGSDEALSGVDHDLRSPCRE